MGPSQQRRPDFWKRPLSRFPSRRVRPRPRSFAAATHTAMATPPAEEIRASSYVGFDSITAQIEHKLLKRGFQFNVIVVGA